MTEQEIIDALIQIETLWLEKTGKAAFCGPSLDISTESKPVMVCWYADHTMTNRHNFRAPTVKDALAEALAFVEAFPDPETIALNEFNDDLAALIDKGHANNVDRKFVDPLRGVRSDVSQMLLGSE